VFSRKGKKLRWSDCSQSPFVQSESGTRAIIAMMTCGVALENHVNLEEAWSRIGLINNKRGNNLATETRNWATMLFENGSECWNEIKNKVTQLDSPNNVVIQTTLSSVKNGAKKRKARDRGSKKCRNTIFGRWVFGCRVLSAFILLV